MLQTHKSKKNCQRLFYRFLLVEEKAEAVDEITASTSWLQLTQRFVIIDPLHGAKCNT